jgi:hypothetical protein
VPKSHQPLWSMEPSLDARKQSYVVGQYSFIIWSGGGSWILGDSQVYSHPFLSLSWDSLPSWHNKSTYLIELLWVLKIVNIWNW